MHGNGLDVQFAAGAQDAQGDFAPIGNDYFVEHARGLLDDKQGLAEFHRVAIVAHDGRDATCAVTFYLFIIFMASMMHSTWPTFTSSPSCTKGLR